MSDFTKLKEVLENQAERGIKSGNWLELTYFIERGTDITLTVPLIKVDFVFTLKGRLIGMFNWQE